MSYSKRFRNLRAESLEIGPVPWEIIIELEEQCTRFQNIIEDTLQRHISGVIAANHYKKPEATAGALALTHT